MYVHMVLVTQICENEKLSTERKNKALIKKKQSIQTEGNFKQ